MQFPNVPKPENSSQADWAHLPVLCLIMDKLSEPIYHARFAVVCKQWHLFAKDYNKKNKALPMLLLSRNNDHKTRRVLYGITVGKIFNNINLDASYARRCCGFSHGWLASVDENMAITLLNPFNKSATKITLPPLMHRPKRIKNSQFNIRKVILSHNPTSSPDNFAVVVIFNPSSFLAFMKPTQQYAWTYLEQNFDLSGFTDITFYGGLAYAVGHWGKVVSFDVNSKNYSSSHQRVRPNIIVPGGWHTTFRFAQRVYIVESMKGDLLVVRRFLERKDIEEEETVFRNVTESFKVHKLLLNDQTKGSLEEHVEVKSLGDEALFVGDNQSISILASNFPGCQPNSIYFTDDNIDVWGRRDNPYLPKGPIDMGIYCLENGTFQKHYTPKYEHRYLAPPLWVVPPLQ